MESVTFSRWEKVAAKPPDEEVRGCDMRAVIAIDANPSPRRVPRGPSPAGRGL